MSNRILSFRGTLLDGNQDTIQLQTNNGLTGYKILKFQVMPVTTATGTNEALVSIWKTPRTTAPSTVNFTDNRLLGAAFYLRDQGVVAVTSQTIIFDHEKFNQNVYVNYADGQGCTGEINYYIELEQMTLSLDEQSVATLKDIRNTGTQ